MNDDIDMVLKMIRVTCIFLIAVGVYLIMSFPNSIELIKLATPREIMGGIFGIIYILSGALTYVYAERIFLKVAKKNKKT